MAQSVVARQCENAMVPVSAHGRHTGVSLHERIEVLVAI